MTIWFTCIACWIIKAADTHSEYVIHVPIAFPLQQWLHERLNVTLYVHRLSCFQTAVNSAIPLTMFCGCTSDTGCSVWVWYKQLSSLVRTLLSRINERSKWNTSRKFKYTILLNAAITCTDCYITCQGTKFLVGNFYYNALVIFMFSLTNKC